MPIPPAQRLSLQCNDGEEAQSFLSQSYVPLRVASTRKPVDFETFAVHCDGMGFSTATSRSGIQPAFDAPFDGYGMSIPLSGKLSVGTGHRAPTTSRADGGLMMDSRTVESAMFSAHSAWHRITASTASTEELHRRLTSLTEQPVHHRLQFVPHFRTDQGTSRLILGLSQALIDGMRGDAPLLSAPAAVVSLKETVLSVFIKGLRHSHSELLGRRVALPAPRHVKRAIEFMHANLLKPLQLEDIAQASQSSARSLQSAFRRFRGTTPMEHLRRLRLEGGTQRTQAGPARHHRRRGGLPLGICSPRAVLQSLRQAFWRIAFDNVANLSPGLSTSPTPTVDVHHLSRVLEFFRAVETPGTQQYGRQSKRISG